SMREIQAGLERLERQEWWRWATALFIMLLLSLGVFSLSLPGPRKDLFTRYQWDLAVPGLFVTILIFNVFVVHQQIRISRFAASSPDRLACWLRWKCSGRLQQTSRQDSASSAGPPDILLTSA